MIKNILIKYEILKSLKNKKKMFEETHIDCGPRVTCLRPPNNESNVSQSIRIRILIVGQCFKSLRQMYKVLYYYFIRVMHCKIYIKLTSRNPYFDRT